MNYYLIDYENVNSKILPQLKDLKKKATVVIFYSDKCKNISLDDITVAQLPNINCQFFKVKDNKKNALDFQLVSYLGYLIGQDKNAGTYYIVSNDKGYEAAAHFWAEKNISVTLIGTSNEQEMISSNKKKKKASSVNGNIPATLSEVTSLIGATPNNMAILTIFNNSNSKVALMNGLSKFYRDSTRASAVYKKLKPLTKSKNKV